MSEHKEWDEYVASRSVGRRIADAVGLVLMILLLVHGCTDTFVSDEQLAEDARNAEGKDKLRWDAFCANRGGKTFINSQKYGTSYYCANGEHTHWR